MGERLLGKLYLRKMEKESEKAGRGMGFRYASEEGSGAGQEGAQLQ